MRKRRKLGRPSHGTVVAYLALFVAIGGSAYAAKQLPKDSVGTRELKRKAVGSGQLKGNAVTRQKIKRNAINGQKVKDNSLTGADIELSKLGTVPSAKSANAAGAANVANVANAAGVANVANSLAPAEDWHEAGAPGGPPLLSSWENFGGDYQTAAFFKDHEGIVHLRGTVIGGVGPFVFELPPGYRPTGILLFTINCAGGACPSGTGSAAAYGPGVAGEAAGKVAVSGEQASLDGISFRAES